MEKQMILLRPIITEKVTKLTEKFQNKVYAFFVNVDANKLEIAQAVEEMYGVQVEEVRTLVIAPRARRRFSKSGILTGATSRKKKAYVTLTEGKELNFYSNV